MSKPLIQAKIDAGLKARLDAEAKNRNITLADLVRAKLAAETPAAQSMAPVSGAATNTQAEEPAQGQGANPGQNQPTPEVEAALAQLLEMASGLRDNQLATHSVSTQLQSALVDHLARQKRNDLAVAASLKSISTMLYQITTALEGN